MTNYGAWDRKADALCKEASEEEKQETEACNAALGLSEGPKGPATAQAEAELKSLKEKSQKRSDLIAMQKGREVSLTHEHLQGVIDLSEYENKAVRLDGCKGVEYVVSGKGVLKIMLDACSDVKLHVKGSLVVSTIEAFKCSRTEITLEHLLGTLQVDECRDRLLVRYAEQEHVGQIWHQNSAGLSIAWGATEQLVGREGAYQLVSRIHEGALHSEPVRRGEGEFPVNFSEARRDAGQQGEAPDRRQEAEKQRLAGNEMFRASDFAQAAALYSLALELCPELASAWANRSQCFLKLGDHEKALADARRCSEVEPENCKGWFRQGVALHALGRYREAIEPLLEAEKLEPSNKQVQDAIRMAQFKARSA